jgi:DNA-binding NarL/FixJ family response regulator
MLEEAKSKNNGKDNESEGLFSRRPNVSLLDDKEWLYVQRCYQLSPRELQVAKHICRGFGNDEVAKELKIRSGTVKTHLRNIYRRIRVTNKIEMLLTFVEQVIALNGKPRPGNGIVDVKSGSSLNNGIQSSQLDLSQQQT